MKFAFYIANETELNYIFIMYIYFYAHIQHKCMRLYIVHVGALPSIVTFYRPSERSFILCFELTAGQEEVEGENVREAV